MLHSQSSPHPEQVNVHLFALLDHYALINIPLKSLPPLLWRNRRSYNPLPVLGQGSCCHVPQDNVHAAQTNGCLPCIPVCCEHGANWAFLINEAVTAGIYGKCTHTRWQLVVHCRWQISPTFCQIMSLKGAKNELDKMLKCMSIPSQSPIPSSTLIIL